MRMPERLLQLIQARYRQSTMVFEVVLGTPVAEIWVASGIRQACSLSGSLLVLALDWLRRLLAAATLFAYADDLAAVLGRLRAELPHLLIVLRRWARVSGLPRKAAE